MQTLRPPEGINKAKKASGKKIGRTTKSLTHTPPQNKRGALMAGHMVEGNSFKKIFHRGTLRKVSCKGDDQKKRREKQNGSRRPPIE